MPAEIEIVAKDDHVRTNLTGESGSVSELLAYIDRMIEVCRESGLSKVLMDHRNFKYEIETVDSYEFGIHLLERMPLGVVSRIALVVPTPRLESARFYETLSAGQMAVVKTFDRVRMATVWLKG